MADKRPKPEENVRKSQQVELLAEQEIPCLDAIRQIGVIDETYSRWKKTYGEIGADQPKELKTLQEEDKHLRKAVSNLALDKLILAETAKKNF